MRWPGGSARRNRFSMRSETRPSSPRSLRQIVLGNLIWLAGCLVLAFLVWVIAILQADPIAEWRLAERVPIRLQPDAGLIITNPEAITSSAAVYLRGPESERTLITGDDVIVSAGLAGFGPGTYVVPLTATVAGSARVENISPSQVTVTLEVEAAQYVPVREDVTAAPPPDVEVVSITFDVLQVEVRGPASQVSRVVAAQAPIDLSQQRAGLQIDVRLQPVDVDNRPVSGVTIAPQTVRATIELQQSESVRQLNVRPQIVGELPPGYFLTAIDYDPQIVYVSVPADATLELPDTVFTAPIDLADRVGPFSTSVRIELPFADATPISETEIRVDISIAAQIITRQFDDIPVELTGQRQNYQYALEPGRVSVILTGPQPVLDRLQAADLRVTADVIALAEAGSFRVPLQAVIAQESSAVTASILPPEALVQIALPAPEVTAEPSPPA